MNPLVSIIIPVKNTESYIEQCVTSALQQSYQNIEVIVVLNDSTDHSRSILHKLSDPRLFIYESKEAGACKARNLGFQHSKGEIIQFLDADDYLHLNKIEIQLKQIFGKKSALCLCGTHVLLNNQPTIHEHEDKVLINHQSPTNFLINLYDHFGMIQTNSWLLTRDLMLKAGLWNKDLLQDQDGEMLCRLVLKSEDIICISNKLHYYRKFSRALTISNNKSALYAASTLKAMEIKTENILNTEPTIYNKSVLAKCFKILEVRYFIIHPNLSLRARDKCIQLGNSDYMPVIGGKIIEIVSDLFGWKLAKRISLLKRAIVNILN